MLNESKINNVVLEWLRGDLLKYSLRIRESKTGYYKRREPQQEYKKEQLNLCI
jgi:hypothetical protein